MFKEVHPTRYAKLKTKDLENSRGVKGNESRFVRCRKCSHINDIEVRGLGNKWDGNISQGTISGTNLKDPIVGQGCVFCGSSNGWEEMDS